MPPVLLFAIPPLAIWDVSDKRIGCRDAPNGLSLAGMG